jgi:hypothetical protein
MYIANSVVLIILASFLSSFVGPLAKIVSSSLGYGSLVGTLDTVQSAAYLVASLVFSIVVFRSVYGFPLIALSAILVVAIIMTVSGNAGYVFFLLLAVFYLVFSLLLSPILAVLPLFYRSLSRRRLWHGLTIGNILSYASASVAYVASGFVFRYVSYWGLLVAVLLAAFLLSSMMFWERGSPEQTRIIKDRMKGRYVLSDALRIHALALKIIVPYLFFSACYSLIRPYLLIIPAELRFGSYEETASVIGLSSLVLTLLVTPLASKFADLYTLHSFIVFIVTSLAALVILYLSMELSSFLLYTIGLILLTVGFLLVSIIYQVVPLRACRDDETCSSRVFNALTVYGRLVSGIAFPTISSYILSMLGFQFIKDLTLWVIIAIAILSAPSIYLFKRLVSSIS